MPGAGSGVDPLGPVFISYRSSDGADLAYKVARALRCAGAPVWHDQEDLPPGDTRTRLQEALARGLSGAVLVVTPEIEHSSVVRDVELPELLRLHTDPDFIFVVASTLERAGQPGRLDFDAPDRLLAQPPDTFKWLKQFPLFEPDSCEKVAERIVRRRMDSHRRLGEETLVIDLQTRSSPQAFTNQTALVVRTPPPKEGFRAPSPETWPPLRSFLAALPALVEASGAKRVLLRGGAHLSAAFALGAALPATGRAGPLAVEDQNQVVWEALETGAPAELTVDEKDLGSPRRPVAVLVDLVPTIPPTDAFGELLESRTTDYSASLRMRLAQPRRLVPEEIGATTAAIASLIRNFAGRHDTNEIHLFLRTPFPAAVLLGRLFNTLRVTLYELEGSVGRSQYLPAITVSSGLGGGPIVAIF
ncbi:MAG TPA: SAVED domain-containing protein [Thermoanaerobaculia bacterium]|nr:SAVED domain-containing protein [Thermoanaerobaculia bacterium]